MSTFTGNNVSSGDIIFAADHNELIALIAAVINGSIDDTNVSTLSGSKITAGTLPGSAITAASVDLGAKASAFDGWVGISDTHTYSSWDSTNKTGVVTVPSDATTKYSLGMRYRISQATGGTKYFIITKISSTSLTIYGGTDYTLTNETISSPSFSVVKAPFGFPLDPTKWTVTVTDTANNTQSNPVSGTWYNPGSISISVPIGAWKLSHLTSALTKTNTAQTIVTVYATLSTANNSESDSELTSWSEFAGASAQMFLAIRAKTEKRIVVTSATTYYLNVMTSAAANSGGSVATRGDDRTTYLKALCAYL